MLKIISRMPVIPRSLIVTGVSMPTERDYIGGGGFGRVFRGELQGTAVALKVLYKPNNNVVSPSCGFRLSLLILIPTGLLSRGVDVAITKTQVCITIFRDL